MKVLVAAIACRPDSGSERYVGWTAVTALAARHEVWVLTHGFNRPDIEHALGNHPLKDRIHPHYLRDRVGWHPNRLVARFQDWSDNARWTADARVLAKDIDAEVKFDVAHHVTFATWRAPSPLAGLGIPWVWGPVGGGESFPAGFNAMLSPSARLFERMRSMANVWASRSPALRRCARDAGFVFANNPETLARMRALGVDPGRLGLLSQSFFPPARMDAFPPSRAKPSVADAGLRIFAGGNLEGRKGVAVALRALRMLKDRGVRFRFRYGGLGPEYGHLLRLRDRLGLDPSEVTLGEVLEGDAYRAALGEAHVYLLPSLREGAPITMIEAMLCGCVPVVACCGGAAVVVDDSCGVAVPVTHPDRMAGDIADALQHLADDPQQLARLSEAATERVRERCSESHYIGAVETAYATAATRGRGEGEGEEKAESRSRAETPTESGLKAEGGRRK